MKVPSNYVIIAMDALQETEIGKGDLKLYRPDLVGDSANHNDKIDVRRIYGEVVAIPAKLGNGPSDRLYQKTDEGRPGYQRPHIGDDLRRDVIEQVIAHEGSDECPMAVKISSTIDGKIEALKEMNMIKMPDKDSYRCFHHEPKWTHLSDIKQDVKVGDRAYFQRRGTDAENDLYMKDEKGRHLYKMRYDQLFCVVRKKKITMLGGWMFLKPIMQKEEDLTSEAGVITQVHIESIFLEATVKHIGPGVGGDTIDVKKESKILYSPESDWENEIEGEKYLCMQQRDILAEIL